MKSKRLIVLGLSSLIVAIIGGYYGTSVYSSIVNEKIELVTIEGDESTVENIELTGEFVQPYTMGESIEVTAEEIELLDTSLIKTDYIYNPPIIKEYQKEYPSFMRGKKNYINNFIENDGFLFYLEDYYRGYDDRSEGLSEISLSIARLNKETKEEAAGEILIEVDYSINYISVYGMSVVNQYIVLDIMIGEMKDYTEHNYYYIYDIDQNKVVDVVEVNEDSVEGENWSRTSASILNSDPVELLLETVEYTEDGDTSNIQLEKYNIEMGEFQSLTIDEPRLLGNEMKSSYFQEDGKIYFFLNDNEDYLLRVFDTRTDEFVFDKEIGLSSDIFQEWDALFIERVEDSGNVILYESYIEANQDDNPSGIAVFDISTFEKKFEGYWKYESKYENANIYIDQITFE